MADHTIFGWATFAASTFTGNEVDGTEFWVTSSSNWVRALRFWRQDTTITGTITGRIYRIDTTGSSSTGSAVPGTDVTWTLSGTGWQIAPLAAPVQLAVNTSFHYKAVIDWATNRIASSSSTYWTSGPGASGFTDGILVAPAIGSATTGNPTTATSTFLAGTTMGYPVSTTDFAYSIDPIVSDTDPTGSTIGLYPTTVASTTGTTWATTTNATGATTGTFATFTNTTSGGAGTIQLSGYDAQAAINGSVQPASIDWVDVTVASHEGSTSLTSAVTVQLFSGVTGVGSATALTTSATTTNSQTVRLTGTNVPTWAQLADLQAQVSFTRTATISSNVFSLDVVGIVIHYTSVLNNRVFLNQAVSRAATY